MRWLALVFLVTGCASGELHSAVDATGSDAAITIDARMLPDGPAGSVDGSAIDGRPDPIDAAPPPPDAQPSVPDATPCTPTTWVPLLANGNFDSGPVSWTQDGGTFIVDNAPLTEHSGTFVARLLSVSNATHTLRQSVTVPSSATAVRLSGYLCFVTNETGGVADTVALELRDGVATETLKSYSNLDCGTICNWTSFEFSAVNDHAGHVVELAFAAHSDASVITTFYFDSLVLSAFACP